MCAYMYVITGLRIKLIICYRICLKRKMSGKRRSAIIVASSVSKSTYFEHQKEAISKTSSDDCHERYLLIVYVLTHIIVQMYKAIS